MQLTKDQQTALEAVMNYLKNPTKSHYVVDGSAGTGKTFLINLLRAKYPNTRVAVCAYTGKAVSVLKNKGIIDAQTLHSLLYNVVVVNNRFKYFLKKELPFDFIIVDEASMVNREFFDNLLSFEIPVIFVGDSYQLPPVEGEEYFNIMDNHDVRLSEIVRQAADNPIIKFASDVKKGNELFYLNINSYGKNIRKIDGKTAFDSLEKYDAIIVSTNKNRQLINHTIRKKLGRNLFTPQAGDKIICRRNKKGAEAPYNGQCFVLNRDAIKINARYDVLLDCATDGINHTFKSNIEHFLETTIDKQEMDVDSPDNDIFPFQFAYAITCHNSQGSEYNNVLIVNDFYEMNMDHLTKCRMTYTAVTRSKENLDIVDLGDIKSFLIYDIWEEIEKQQRVSNK